MSDFSRKHYKRIALIIAQCSDRYGDKQFLFNEFCAMFEEDNNLFDRDKFAEACGMKKQEHLERAIKLIGA